MVDLSPLVPPSSGLQIYETDQINNRGEIAVQGQDANGNNHGVLLIPCDENHPGVEGCDYSMVDAVTAAKSDRVHAVQPSSALAAHGRVRFGLRDQLRRPMVGQNRFGSAVPK
jgi:hypothetical protein